VVALSLGLVACRHGPQKSTSEAAAKPAPALARTNRSATIPKPPGARQSVSKPSEPAPRYPSVTPVDVAFAKVVVVRPTLRFVVLDFSLQPLPRIHQRLSLFRQDQKVGEVTVTGPARGSTIVADLLSGEAQVGDDARVD